MSSVKASFNPNQIFKLIKQLGRRYLNEELVKRYLPKTRVKRNILWTVLIGGSVGSLIFQIFKARRMIQGWVQNWTEASSSIIKNWEITRVRRGNPRDLKLFALRLWSIVKIIIPSHRSDEFFHIIVLTVLLIARTLLSIKLADITGKNAQYLVELRWADTLRGIMEFAALGIPACCVNNGLRYETSMLSLRFKKRLSKRIHEEYLSGVNMYQVAKLGGETEVPNVDMEVEKFCDGLSKLYTIIFKPILEILLVTYRISSVIGIRGPLIFFGYYGITGFIRRFLLPSFDKLKSHEAMLIGQYRTAIHRFIINAEEISFYSRTTKERTVIGKLLSEIYQQSALIHWLKTLVGVFDDFLTKYVSSICGYIVLGLPFYFPPAGGELGTLATRTMHYVRSRQLLINLGESVGQLVMVPNKLASLATNTSRLYKLFEVVRRIESSGVKPFELATSRDVIEKWVEDDSTAQWLQAWKKSGDEERIRRSSSGSNVRVAKTRTGERAQIIEGNFIKFENVSIVSPHGQLIVENLTFDAKPGQNVLVTGASGSGKTSLFRIIGELWPLYCGTVVKPRKEDVLFVPQNPYLVLGTLRDQIIYPHSYEDMKTWNVTDEDLNKLMTIVDPTGSILQSWKWDDINDWYSLLNAEQKQRLAAARLFYHRPLYAMLDQSTSTLSDEVVTKIYQTCRDLGITLFTVSHRPLSKKYHDYILRFGGHQGHGKWEWTEVNPSTPVRTGSA